MFNFRQPLQLVLLASVLGLGLWGFQLNAVHQQMLGIQKMEQQVKSAFLQAAFPEARETLLKLTQETNAVRQKSIRYAIIQNTFQHPSLPSDVRLQQRLDEATKFAQHDFKRQLMQMSSGDLEDLKKGQTSFLRFSDYAEINAGALKQAQAVYQTHQIEIEAHRAAHLEQIQNQFNAQRAIRTPQAGVAVTQVSTETQFNELKSQAAKHLANKEITKAYQFAAEADTVLIKGLVSKSITQADFTRLDDELSRFKKQIDAKS